jgi:hypothetical protein
VKNEVPSFVPILIFPNFQKLSFFFEENFKIFIQVAV